MTRAPRRAGPAREHPAGQEMIALVGGPWDGRWFWPADWAAQTTAAEWGARVHGYPPGHSTLHALGYEATAEWVGHPKPFEWPQGGTVWKWRRRPVDE